MPPERLVKKPTGKEENNGLLVERPVRLRENPCLLNLLLTEQQWKSSEKWPKRNEWKLEPEEEPLELPVEKQDKLLELLDAKLVGIGKMLLKKELVRALRHSPAEFAV